jgi:hypothetical protein
MFEGNDRKNGRTSSAKGHVAVRQSSVLSRVYHRRSNDHTTVGSWKICGVQDKWSSFAGLTYSPS